MTEGRPWKVGVGPYDCTGSATIELALPLGLAINGKVTEADSGAPVAGAAVHFLPRTRRQREKDPRTSSRISSTASDGSFHLGALPGPGRLLVAGPTDDFILQLCGDRMFDDDRPRPPLIYSHGQLLLDVNLEAAKREVHVKLRRGLTLEGQVVGEDGKGVEHAWLFSRVILSPNSGGSRAWRGGYHGTTTRDGRFKIHGLERDVPVAVSLHGSHDPRTTKRAGGAKGVYRQAWRGTRTGRYCVRAVADQIGCIARQKLGYRAVMEGRSITG